MSPASDNGWGCRGNAGWFWPLTLEFGHIEMLNLACPLTSILQQNGQNSKHSRLLRFVGVMHL